MAGLGYRQPLTAAMLIIFLLSLIGVPLTGGFFGKFYVFKAALDANLVWLTVLGLLNSAVAAYYYLRIIVVMYMHEPTSVDGRSAAVERWTEDCAPGFRCRYCRFWVCSRRWCSISPVLLRHSLSSAEPPQFHALRCCRCCCRLSEKEIARFRWLRLCGE